MTHSDLAELLEKALELPAAKRLNLASELLESVEGPEDPDWAAAWRAELDRRAAEFERGDVKGEDWATLKARLMAKLDTQ